MPANLHLFDAVRHRIEAEPARVGFAVDRCRKEDKNTWKSDRINKDAKFGQRFSIKMYKDTYIQTIVQAAKKKPDRLCPVENRSFKEAFLPL